MYRNGIKHIDIQEFFTLFLVLSVKRSTFQSRENTTVSNDIFGPAFCITDVMNKAGICGKSIKYVTSQSFSALRG